MRSSPILKKQDPLLKSLALPHPSGIRPSYGNEPIEDIIGHVVDIADYYGGRIAEKGTGLGNVKNVMKVVSDEIEANGVHGAKEIGETVPVYVRSVHCIKY